LIHKPCQREERANVSESPTKKKVLGFSGKTKSVADKMLNGSKKTSAAVWQKKNAAKQKSVAKHQQLKHPVRQ
jgi:hypothetical protein